MVVPEKALSWVMESQNVSAVLEGRLRTSSGLCFTVGQTEARKRSELTEATQRFVAEPRLDWWWCPPVQ